MSDVHVKVIPIKSSILAFCFDLFGVVTFTLTQFIFIPLFVTEIGDDEFGKWLTLVAFFSFFALLDLGSNHSILQRSIKTLSKKNSVIKKSFFFNSLVLKFLVLILATLSGLTILIFANIFTTIRFDLIFQFLIWSIILITIYGYCSAIISSFGYLHIAHLIYNLILILTYIFAYFLMKYEWGVEALTISQLLFGVFFTIVFLIFTITLFIRQKINFKFIYFNLNYLKKLIIRSLQYLKINFSQAIFAFADHLIIALLLGPAYVAVYFINLRLASLISANITRISSAIFPYYTQKFYMSDKKTFLDLTVQISKIVVKLSIYGSLLIFCIHDLFVYLWVGEDYKIDPLFKYFLFVLIIRDSIVKSLTQFVMATGNIVNLSNTLLYESFFKIFLSLIFTLEYGLLGTLISHVISTLFFSSYIVFQSLGIATKVGIKNLFKRIVINIVLNNLIQIIIIILLYFILINYETSWVNLIYFILISLIMFFSQDFYRFIFKCRGNFQSRILQLISYY